MNYNQRLNLINKLRTCAFIDLLIGIPASVYTLLTKSYIQNPKYSMIEDKIFSEVGFIAGIEILWETILIWLILSALATLLEGQMTLLNQQESTEENEATGNP